MAALRNHFKEQVLNSMLCNKHSECLSWSFSVTQRIQSCHPSRGSQELNQALVTQVRILTLESPRQSDTEMLKHPSPWLAGSVQLLPSLTARSVSLKSGGYICLGPFQAF